MRIRLIAQKFSQINTADLLAIGPLDGRYKSQIGELSDYFSEYALIKYRVKVELKWLEYLNTNNMIKRSHQTSYKNELQKYTNDIVQNFGINHAIRVKEIQKSTNHDVKAVEYFIKEQLDKIPALKDIKQYVHFCCTSEDINNLSYAWILEEANKNVINKYQNSLLQKLISMSQANADVVMLSRTHGQSATPTTLGKQTANFAYRLSKHLKLLKQHKFQGKFNGAVGNFNAHIFAYPQFNWPRISQGFVEKLGLSYNPYTTQIQPHDSIASYSNTLALFNTVLIGMSRDFWQYISMGYFQQKSKQSQVGSSTMPHKINPIDFENCQGNLGLANSLLSHFSNKLPISRLQRDLSDSTVLRNQGLAFGYSITAYKSLIKGLNKLDVNKALISHQLNNSYQVVSQAVQTLLRKNGYKDPYQMLKSLTRGKRFTQQSLKQLISNLSKEGLRQQQINLLNSLTPTNYIGNAKEMAQKIRQHIDN